MKRVYVVLSLITALIVVSCGNSDKTSEDVESNTSTEDVAKNEENPAAVIEAYANDKSSISILDIDQNDNSFTTRTKSLYVSDENGKKMAVVYGFKAGPSGIAIVEVEGEKPIKLNQVKTEPGVPYEFTNGTITLKRTSKAAELSESGEVVVYKEIF